MKKVILFLAVFLLTGCYDYHELNDLEIISSVVVDYKDDEYIVNIEVLDTSDTAKTGSFFLNGEGKTLEEAMNNVYFDSAHTPFYSHMKTMIISETVAEKGIEPFLDYLLRDTQFRKDFFVFVSRDVDAILEYETQPKESIGEMAKMNAKRNHEENGKYKTCTFREIVFDYLRNNYYMIGNLEIKDEIIILEDTYLFINNKLGLKLDAEAALLENMLMGSNNKFQTYDDYTYEIHEYKLDKKIKKDKIVITIKGLARILDAKKDNSLSDSSLIKLEEDLNRRIEKEIGDIIKYAMRLDHDMFNFNYYYYLYHPKDVEDNTWKNIKYEIKSDLSISEKGLLLSTLGGRENGK